MKGADRVGDAVVEDDDGSGRAFGTKDEGEQKIPACGRPHRRSSAHIDICKVQVKSGFLATLGMTTREAWRGRPLLWAIRELPDVDAALEGTLKQHPSVRTEREIAFSEHGTVV